MKNKKFDAVKMMREIRDDLSQKYSKMTLEEQIQNLNKKFSGIHWKNLQKDKATVNKSTWIKPAGKLYRQKPPLSPS